MKQWLYKGNKIESVQDLPPETFSFVYRITNLDNKRTYIGKKQVVSVNKKLLTKKDKLLPENKRKKYKIVVSHKKDWPTYNGSNVQLLEDIELGANIEKEILVFCKTKNQATYFETKYQFQEGVLEDMSSYNDNILGKFYRKSLLDSNSSVKDELNDLQ